MIFGDSRLPERFWAKVFPEPNTGCWLWAGCLVGGYGTVRFNGKMRKTHRLTTLAGEGTELDHLCRERSCCNPDHLEAVDHRVNVLRGEAYASRQARQTVCIRNHPLSGGNLYIVPSTGSRQCQECKRLRRAAEAARASERKQLGIQGKTGRPPGAFGYPMSGREYR